MTTSIAGPGFTSRAGSWTAGSSTSSPTSSWTEVEERRRAHWCLCEFEGMSANAAGLVTGHSRGVVRNDLDRVRAEIAGSVPKGTAKRREAHWRLVMVEGLSATQAGKVTGETGYVVAADLHLMRGLDRYREPRLSEPRRAYRGNRASQRPSLPSRHSRALRDQVAA